jgi:SAM-dependent methyltransferase
MPSEFDHYADQYAKLLKDPIRDKFASDSQFFHQVKWALLQDFCRRADWPVGQASWLDVGCGSGDLLRLGAARFKEVAGCDPSVGMLAQCGNLNVRVQEQPDRVPFPEQSFDLVTAVCVYHHIALAARSRLTEQVFRVLRPGGVFCIIEHNPFNPAAQWIVRHCPIDVHARLLTAHRVRKFMRGAGLNIVETNYFLYFPERIHRRLAIFERSLRRLPLGGQYAVFGRR